MYLRIVRRCLKIDSCGRVERERSVNCIDERQEFECLVQTFLAPHLFEKRKRKEERKRKRETREDTLMFELGVQRVRNSEQHWLNRLDALEDSTKGCK